MKTGLIEGMIKTCMDFQIPKEEIIQKIRNDFSLPQEEAEQFVKKFQEKI